MAVGFAALSRSGDLWAILASCAAIGAGSGILFPFFISAALDIAPATRRGLASGAMTAAIFTGQFLSPIISQFAIGQVGYRVTFTGWAVVFVAAACMGLMLFRRSASAPSGA